MTDTVLQSEAFRKAVLKSERVRVVGLLWTVGLAFTLAVVRTLISGDVVQMQALPVSVGLFLVFMAFEGVMFSKVHRAIATGKNLPGWIWPLVAFIETLLPTASIMVMTESEFLGPYRALVAPGLTAYFFFIGLSTLRLDPLLSRWTGICSAGGYGLMVLYTFQVYPAGAPGALPVGLYITHALFLLVGGWIAGAVAGQIRNHVGTALVEARQSERMERDIEVARNIQQGLLPAESPRIEGFEIAGWNQPADETGGDYFDWLPLADGRVAVMLGDVTGHGIGPALVTAACRAYGRASMASGGDLGSALGKINSMLSKDLPSGKLVTFVTAVVDPSHRSVQLLSAGHGPLLLYTAADNRVQSFNAHGVPLGVMAEMSYGPAQKLDLAPGDALVLVTDGFFEWANTQSEQFGIDRLEQAVRDASDQSAATIISTLYKKVSSFVGDVVQDDDLTAVVIKRTA
jgi:hypothetical protein